MRAVIQRVSEAQVEVEGDRVGSIDHGLLILLGVEANDTIADAEWLAKKTTDLRIFNDEVGKMNLSIGDVNGSILVVSQFTLHAKYKKGTRPSFIHSAKPDLAEALYNDFQSTLSNHLGKPVETGVFGAQMNVHLINNGPVTILMDTKNKE